MTSVGDIDLDETGRLDLSTGVGAITVARVGGDAEVTTGTGRIRLGQIDGSAVPTAPTPPPPSSRSASEPNHGDIPIRPA